MNNGVRKFQIGLVVVMAALVVMGDVCFGVASAKWVPGETLLLVSVENVNSLREKFKQSSPYALYKDPAMQAFMVPAEEKIRKKFQEGLKKVWGELGLEEPPKEIPWPEGKVIGAFFLQERKTTVPDFSKVHEMAQAGQEVDYNNLPQRETKVQDFQVVVMAQMGEKLSTVQKLARKATSKAVEKGMVRERVKVRGVEITIIKKNAEVDENYDTLCYGFKDDWLIVGSSLKYIREVVVRMSGAGSRSLADERDFKEMQQNLGAGDVTLFFNSQRLLDVIKATTPPEGQQQVTTMIEALGFANTSGLGVTVQMGPSKTEEIKIKALLGVRGEKKGVPALLTPTAGSLRPNRMLGKGIASFTTANYDIGKMYNEIVQMVWNIGQFNLDGMVQAAMMGTGTLGGEGGQPPVDFKKDVLGQLTSPITMAVRTEKPYTERDSSQTLLAIGVRDGEILDTALARIHSTFVAKGKPEMRRELSGTTIYLLPNFGFPGMMGWGAMGQGSGDKDSEVGFAVVGDQFVFGGVKGIEQAIRNLGRKDFVSIKADPMYQYASRYLPSQAGAFCYENTSIGTEAMWVNLTAAARLAAAGDGKSGSASGAEMSRMPLGMMVEQLKEYCDFSLLPEFEKVKKYFGASVSYVVGTDKGIYVEMIGLKAPKN